MRRYVDNPGAAISATALQISVCADHNCPATGLDGSEQSQRFSDFSWRVLSKLRDRVRRRVIVHAKYDDVMVIAEAADAEHGRQSTRAKRQVESVIGFRRYAVRISSRRTICLSSDGAIQVNDNAQ